MSANQNFLFHLNVYDDYKEIPFSDNLHNLSDAYIICKYSFGNQNVDIHSFIHNLEIPVSIPQGIIKTNFTIDEIKSFKNKQIDFYILGKGTLYNIFKKRQINTNLETKIYLIDKINYKILYFLYESRCISFKVGSIKNNNNNALNYNNNNNQINQNQISNNEFSKNNFNNFNFTNQQNTDSFNMVQNFQTNQNNTFSENPKNMEHKLNIIKNLILLYVNEKEIQRLYSQGIKELKNYYLVNKSWIDTFKQMYHYYEICNIPTIQGINSYDSAIKNLKSFESLAEIQSILSLININNSPLMQFNLPIQTKICGEYTEYDYPINFVIINGSILNLLKQFGLSNINVEYQINFGKSSLCLRTKYDSNKTYIYNYNNTSFNIIGIIDVFADVWETIYNRYLSQKLFSQYLIEKNINLNIFNKKQNLLSSGQKHLGYIYLIPQMNNNDGQQIIETFDNMNNFENKVANENINKNIDFQSVYLKFYKSLSSLKHNNYDLPNTESIRNYFSSNLLIHLSVFIIESQKLKYCIDTIKQLKNTMDDFSFCLSENDILSSDSLSESTRYSCINEEIINYFKIQNTNNLPKAFIFINQKISYVFYPQENCLLKVSNYKNNSFILKKVVNKNTSLEQEQFFSSSDLNGFDFNIPKDNNNESFISPPKPPENPPEPGKVLHALGLENIGATCYMNATLQSLSHVLSLKEYLLDDNRYNQDILSRNASLSKSFADVVRKLWSETYETYYAPREFKDLISQMNPLFQGIQANDSKDLVIFIFENIHRELNNPSQNPDDINLNVYPNELRLFRQNYYSQNYSIISKIFYYEQSSIMECLNCHFKTNNYNIMNILIFPLEKVRLYKLKQNPKDLYVITLFDCFEQNQQPEILDGANQIYCNNCRQSANASSCNKLNTCPEVLTIILNRGKGIEHEVNFSFPMSMSIVNYVTDKSYDPNYELIAVLTHFGPSGMAGHFVAYCKSPVDNNWYFYNDATVTLCRGDVANQIVSNGIPYILFYQRRKLKIATNVENKCIYFSYEGKEGYYDYTDDNKMLSEAYSEFRSKYDWAPQGGRLMLMKNNNMIDLDEYKSLKDNGISDKDKICVLMN